MNIEFEGWGRVEAGMRCNRI